MEMEFGGGKRYNSYSSYIKTQFDERVQKVSLDTGFTCPNRDGSKGVGGCTYCNNNSFNPNYCKPTVTITDQLNTGIEFFSKKKKPINKFLAYFQAYTNTYADIELVKELYLEAVNHPDIVGLVVGTRPDCINEDLIQFMSDLAKEYYVSLEFGVESTLNRTLDAINRCHTFEETKEAYQLSKDRGMHLGAHMILGLPGESREDILGHVYELNKLPIHSLKLHQLQIIKHTMMAHQLKKEPEMFQLFDMDEYIDLITEFVARLRPDIVIERFISQSPAHLLLAPHWGVKNFEIVDKIEKRLREKDYWQGKLYKEEVIAGV